jgi:hypothetical protein
MNKKRPATLTQINPWYVFCLLFASVFTIVFCVCILRTKFATKFYSGHAVVQITLMDAGKKRNFLQAVPNAIPSRAFAAEAFAPMLIQAEVKTVESDQILHKAIWNLGLNEAWGRKFFSGATLKTWETLPILKNRIGVNAFHDKPLIMISCWDENSVDAANIANGIARAYLDYSHTNPDSMGVEIFQSAKPNPIPFNIDKKQDIIFGITLAGGSGLVAGLGMAGVVIWVKRGKIKCDASIPPQ